MRTERTYDKENTAWYSPRWVTLLSCLVTAVVSQWNAYFHSVDVLEILSIS